MYAFVTHTLIPTFLIFLICFGEIFLQFFPKAFAVTTKMYFLMSLSPNISNYKRLRNLWQLCRARSRQSAYNAGARMPREDVHVRRRSALGRRGCQRLAACRSRHAGRSVNGADRVHLLRRLRVRPRARRRVGASKRVQRARRTVQLVVRRSWTSISAASARRRPRQTTSQPRVTQSGVRWHSRNRIPLETPPDEVQEERVVATFESRL